MAEIHSYEVFEVRRCEVRAESPKDAMMIAALRFDGIDDTNKYRGRVTRVPRIIDLQVRELPKTYERNDL